MRTFTFIHTYIRTYIRTYIYIHSYIHTRIHTLMHTFILSTSGLSSPKCSLEVTGGSFQAVLGSARQIALRISLETHFGAFLSSACQMALRKLLGSACQIALWRFLATHLKQFWVQLTKLLSGGLWTLICSISWLSLPNGSQAASGGSFVAFSVLSSPNGSQEASGAHFEHFWAQLAKWLSGDLWSFILSISGLSSPNGSQEVSGGSF